MDGRSTWNDFLLGKREFNNNNLIIHGEYIMCINVLYILPVNLLYFIYITVAIHKGVISLKYSFK